MLGLGKSPRNRRRSDRPRLKLPDIAWRRWLPVAASVVLLAVGAFGARSLLDQPIETVQILGRFQRVQPLDVEQAVRARARGVGLIGINLPAVRHSVEQLPWVDKASIERAWPRGLRVTVTEQVAAARWGTNGLLNARGELFMSESRHIPTELPKLSGPNGSEQKVAQRYLAAQGRLVEAGMRITSLRLDARGAWEMDLDNGVTVRLGRRQVDERFERFMLAGLRLVAQRGGEIRYVDMRYTNGFAVGWRSASGSPGAAPAGLKLAAAGAVEDAEL
jgi:cell division protein FtsQ